VLAGDLRAMTLAAVPQNGRRGRQLLSSPSVRRSTALRSAQLPQE
jgi:hypothetical protein